jgi:uncharacterized membrane protein YtjA (UPF0391 family)
METARRRGEDEVIHRRPAQTPVAPGSTTTHSWSTDMLHYAVVFLVIALIAAVLGFGGIAAGAAGIAKILFVVFVILAVGTFLFGRNRG